MNSQQNVSTGGTLYINGLCPNLIFFKHRNLFFRFLSENTAVKEVVQNDICIYKFIKLLSTTQGVP